MKIRFLLVSLAFINTNIFALETKLTVGSTFDYPPLTYIENGKFKGYDIKIIEDFAKTNHFTLQWIKTSWPNLTNDLQSNKFVLAGGGINNTPQRRKLFLVSDPISSTKKVALVRCKDIDKFRTVASIDSTNTKVVENKGGTNEQFAVENFKNANIITTTNNDLPFKFLIDNKADIMFTDDIEANYKHQQNPLLCVAKLNVEFPTSDKVLLFAKNDTGKKLQLLFNQWWTKNKNIYNLMNTHY